VQLGIAEAGSGCAERLWCLIDAPPAAGRGGLGGGVGRQGEPGTGEERLQCPGERCAGGAARLRLPGGGQHRGRGVAAAGEHTVELVQQRDRPRG
jgi:hypothetical protein